MGAEVTSTSASGWYRKFFTRIWSDPNFLKLSASGPSAQMLLVFLLTCREGNFVPGVVCLGIAAIAEILNWDLEPTKQAMAELVENNEVRVDLRNRLIFVPRALVGNKPQNSNQVLGWRINWDEIPKCELKREIWECLSNHLKPLEPHTLHETFLTACKNPSVSDATNAQRGPRDLCTTGSANSLGNGSEDGSKTITTRITSRHHYQEYQDQETNQVQVGPDGGLVGNPPAGVSLGREEGGAGSRPEALLDGHLPGPGLLRPEGPSLDDFDDWVEQQNAANNQPPEPDHQRNKSEGHSWELIRAWNQVVKFAGHPLTTVEGANAEALVPAIIEALKDPQAAEDFIALFRIIPLDSFYRGTGKKKWYATLEHYVLQSPEKRHHAANIARQKLASMDANKVGNKPVAEKLALEALKQRQGGPIPTSGKPSQILNLVRKGE